MSVDNCWTRRSKSETRFARDFVGVVVGVAMVTCRQDGSYGAPMGQVGANHSDFAPHRASSTLGCEILSRLHIVRFHEASHATKKPTLGVSGWNDKQVRGIPHEICEKQY